MSLKEEIYKLMLRARSYDEVEGQDSQYFTDEIISKIEKRIDSISIPEMVNGIYTKPSMEYIAKYMIQQFKEMLK